MLPKDPFILFSVVNTELRDHFFSLEALCDDHGISVQELTGALEAAGFRYDPTQNQFR